MDDRARVEELLGRPPRGAFDVVVRDDDGDPVVLRNAPFLDDGTPMPTRYYLVGRDLVADVSRLEAAGGVKQAEAEIPADQIAGVHTRYAVERDSQIGDDHPGPRPYGGVGGTREGVKCLHAHVAHHLATGDDPVGAWALARLGDAGSRPTAGSLVVDIGDANTALEVRGGGRSTLPLGAVTLADEIFGQSEVARPEDLSNAIGSVQDHFEDVLMEFPGMLATPAVWARGAHAEMLARVEIGTDSVTRSELARPDLEEVFRTLVAEDHATRAENPGLDSGHVRSIVGACCVILGIMRRLQADHVTVEPAAPSGVDHGAPGEVGTPTDVSATAIFEVDG